MSFTALPEEILLHICVATTSILYLDNEFRDFITNPTEDILWEDRGLAHLASVNRRVRRLCMPLLFSGIIINVQDPNNTGFCGKLKAIACGVMSWPHITKHVRCVLCPCTKQTLRCALFQLHPAQVQTDLGRGGLSLG